MSWQFYSASYRRIRLSILLVKRPPLLIYFGACTMNIITALKQRHSTRAFTKQAVTNEQIKTILTAASYSPSGANVQPWQVSVLSGDTKQRLDTLLEQAFYSGEEPSPHYRYYPSEWSSPYTERRRACGLQLYKSLAIDKKDGEARKAQWAANYRAFDAPVLLLFFIDKEMEAGSFLDYGMFLQSLMLAAQEQGLATCPQAALADYPEHIRSLIDYNDNQLLLCGVALGYEDTAAAINNYRTPRESVLNFTQFFD